MEIIPVIVQRTHKCRSWLIVKKGGADEGKYVAVKVLHPAGREQWAVSARERKIDEPKIYWASEIVAVITDKLEISRLQAKYYFNPNKRRK